MDDIATTLCAFDCLDSIYAMMGTNALHIHAFFGDAKELEDFIHKELYTMDGILEVHSNIMIKRYKNDRILLV